MKNRTSTLRDRLKWAARSGIPVLLAVLLLAGAAWLALPRWGRPPVLRADGVLYQPPNTYTLEAQGDLTYLGEVAGVVARHRMPEKELWANHDLAGAAVYRRADGNLAVLEQDGQWYVYRVLE